MLELREKCYRYYVAYEKIVKWLFQFFSVFILLFFIASQFGYEDKFKNPVILIGASVIGAFVTDSIRVLLVFLFTVVQIYFMSPILAGIVFLVGFFLFFMLLHYDCDSVMAVAFMPLFLWCKIPCFIVILLGLLFTPVSILSICSGVIMYYVLQSVKMCETASGIRSVEIFSLLKKFFDPIFYNKEMYVMLFTVCVVLLGSYLLRRRKINYSFEIAIVFGTVSNVVLLFLGNIFFECNFSGIAIFVGSLISGVMVFIVHFFHMALDYGAVEDVQFEDDDYFYYVRAVPKMKMTVEERTVKHIYTNHKQEEKKAAVVKRAVQPRSDRETQIWSKEQSVVVTDKPEQNTEMITGMQQAESGKAVSSEQKSEPTQSSVHTQQSGNRSNKKRTQHSRNGKHRKKSKRKR